MPVKKGKFAPEYLSFYIAGVHEITVPLDHDRVGIVGTDQCINVGCLYWNDGDTTITLGPFDELAKPEKPPKFDRMLDTPEYHVILSDALTPELMTMPVPDARTRGRGSGLTTRRNRTTSSSRWVRAATLNFFGSTH